MAVSKYLVILFCLLHVPALAQLSFGSPQKINAGWKFALGDNPDAKNVAFNDDAWQATDVPHDWSIKSQLSPTLASSTGYLEGGIGWYRKTFDVPKAKTGQKVYLYFEGVYNRSEVFVNGHSLGRRPNGYISFAYDATPYVNYGQSNLVSVRVDHSQSADSRWYTGSGIYRDVWLVFADPVHIAQWGVFAYPEVKKGAGSLRVEIEVENGSASDAKLTVKNELLSAQGNIVAATTKELPVGANSNAKTTATLEVKNPKLWDLEQPNLYQLRTTVLKDGVAIDTSQIKTGFRTFAFDANKGFALNGKWMKQKGVCLHHDAGVLGSAVPRTVLKSRLQTLKDIGVNAIRTSHNPQSPQFYELCDELGLLVLNEAYDEWEFPKRKWLTGWNTGTPGFQGSFDIFVDWAEKDLEDFVRRDRNHLSVFAWSIGNEVDYPNDPYSHPILDGDKTNSFSQASYGGFKKDAPDATRLGAIAKRLVAAVKKHDKSRPTTAGLAGVAMSNETEYPGALDIAGYNYTESKYASDHKKYPKRVIYGSENGHHIEAWLAVKENDHIFGQFLWTGIDYLGEAHKWPSRGFSSGLVDFAGQIKPRGYFRQSLWSEKPMVYAGTYLPEPNEKSLSIDASPLWNYNAGQVVRVVGYTNTYKVRLELNGQTLGEKKYDPKTGIVYWDVPYSQGKLELVGLDSNGKELARYAINSSTQPRALSVKNKNITVAKSTDVAQILVEVVDKDGIPVVLSDNEITCTITGPGKLFGLEAGNNQDMTDYTDAKQRVYNGKLTAFVRRSETQPITVTFTSPWLESVEVVIKSE